MKWAVMCDSRNGWEIIGMVWRDRIIRVAVSIEDGFAAALAVQRQHGGSWMQPVSDDATPATLYKTFFRKG